MKKILLLLSILILGILNVNAATNPYNEKGPYGTNCTWYAWKMAYEKSGVALPGLGDAKNWYDNAKNKGYTVGATPKSNSIIVWGNWTSYGHVGYVESVEGNIIHVWDSASSCIDREDLEFMECMANGVSEESDRICYANAKRIACEYTISPSDYEITGYIYLDYPPEKPVTTNKEDTSPDTIITKSNNAYLSNIELSSGTINFDKEVSEYIVVVENEIDVITITATTEDTKATVSGIGDYKLNVGLNEIKLIVTAEDNTMKEYIIKITRNEKKEVDLNSDTNNNQNEETTSKNDNAKIIILVINICFLILLVVCLIFAFKRKKYNKNEK